MPRKAAADDPLMTPAEVAEYLNVPLQTLYNWRSEGKGPESFKLASKGASARVRYRLSSLHRWLADCGDTTVSAGR